MDSLSVCVEQICVISRLAYMVSQEYTHCNSSSMITHVEAQTWAQLYNKYDKLSQINAGKFWHWCFFYSWPLYIKIVHRPILSLCTSLCIFVMNLRLTCYYYKFGSNTALTLHAIIFFIVLKHLNRVKVFTFLIASCSIVCLDNYPH